MQPGAFKSSAAFGRCGSRLLRGSNIQSTCRSSFHALPRGPQVEMVQASGAVRPMPKQGDLVARSASRSELVGWCSGTTHSLGTIPGCWDRLLKAKVAKSQTTPSYDPMWPYGPQVSAVSPWKTAHLVTSPRGGTQSRHQLPQPPARHRRGISSALDARIIFLIYIMLYINSYMLESSWI